MDSHDARESPPRLYQKPPPTRLKNTLTQGVELSVLEAPIQMPDRENDVNRDGQEGGQRKTEGNLEDGKAQEHDDQEHSARWKLILITIGLCMSVFCLALDETIIATAIPRITDEFHALNDVGWYAAAYLLTICSFQLLIGKLYVLYSVKWVFLGALGFFELGSLISGVAPNSTALTFGRAVAGVGAAGLFSGAFLIIAQAVPLRQRPAYIGFVGAMFTIASVAGPLLGGVFTSRLTWRWCFYINLPFGGVTALFIVVFFKSYGKGQDGVGWKQQIFQLDLEGTVCFLPGIISLLLALQWGGTKYPWSNGRIIGLFVVFAVLVIAFVLIQVWKQERATVPPRIFLNRNVWGCAIFGACFGASFFLLIYYIPIWFQAIKGVSAFRSGIMNLPSILGVVVMSMIVGGATTAIGYYTPFIYASSVIMSVGAGLLTTFTVDTTSARWIGYQIIYGLGAGMGMQQPLIAIQATLSAQDIAIGTAIFVFAETAGGAIFIAVGQNIFTNQLMKHVVAANIPQLDPALILQTGATQLRSLVPPQYLRPLLVAYNKAVIRTWYVVVGMAALSIVGAFFMEWKSVKGKKVNELMTTA